MCLFLGIFLSLRKMLSSPQVWVSMAYYSFSVFLETLWRVIMLMKLLMTVQDVWGLQVVHLLANIGRGWICPQREGKPVTIFFPPSRLNSLVSYCSFRKKYFNSPQSWFFSEIGCGGNTSCYLAHDWKVERKRDSASSRTSVLLAARSSAGIKPVPPQYSWDTHQKGLSCCRAMLPGWYYLVPAVLLSVSQAAW